MAQFHHSVLSGGKEKAWGFSPLILQAFQRRGSVFVSCFFNFLHLIGFGVMTAQRAKGKGEVV